MTTIFFDNGQCLQTATSVKDLWIMLRDMQKANRKFWINEQASIIINPNKIVYIEEDKDDV